ncbi:DMSO/selenate family reductase complex A subunit [Dermatophilus congolensis]|uniref:DMSO/selenate family reductase complex A subunit n=1 Tax=Dermatophilus congolensis TaxID=1863 RepID=UPI001AAF41CD|nr:DMSO/selenate family reductase complex A subunit [Dermatophilus congolensis]MBO3130089.1 molybdopterin-dependent oxidoreductase [Dermatophilus congolensis]MBO3131284.1 molybdopterin-dependent oxidoreductase [Dermatophilus congolensis]MBO3134560.1 molybdopterin-dependent oxidoreductase [Dermatophilus congolensis]MBO3136797.1 molybdopterin-dependent oxidoreductase [Dermatophilus congolensis]MBO3139041.1 molybdopterin-dependent oxidoreductase [Dermatophilus congolensis]
MDKTRPLKTPIARRSVLKWSAIAGGGVALMSGCARPQAPASPAPIPDEAKGVAVNGRTVWSACVINCGSRCPLRLQVENGTVVRVLPDNTGDDSLLNRQIRACVRGRNMRQRIYNPDRIKKPLKRVGKRGEGKWQEISWNEAFDLFAKKLKHTIDTYGNEAIFKTYGSGTWNAHLGYSGGWPRLFNLLGGHLGYYANYSYGNLNSASIFQFGNTDEQMSNSFEDAATHSRLLVLWGNNPQETRMSGGGNTYTSLLAKKKGLKVILVDPRYSDSGTVLADQWIAPRPGTDAALVAGMAHVMITEKLHDKEFLDTYCQGFDEDHMPEGIPEGNSYESYILGKGPDKTPKTPAWAAKITGVPEQTIIAFAREVATTKPTNITQGWGPQRHANGENQARAIYTLAAMIGQVGIPGGGTGGREGYYWPVTKWFPDGDNPVKTSISFYSWTDAITRGTEMTAISDGVRGGERLKSNIKFILSYGGNMLASQHGDINRTKKILTDESLAEFICVVDNQMTASAHLADLVLPDTTTAERWDLVPSEYTGDMAYLIMAEKAIEPLFDSKPAYEMCTEIAKRMGIEKQFTEGRTLEEWARHMQAETVKEHPDFPDFDTLRKKGVHRYHSPEGMTVALKDFREDPEKNKLPTPSGKIEIFSTQLWEMAKTWTFPEPRLPGDIITAIPMHIDTWEGATAAKTDKRYPLQVIGHHFKGRTHSTYGNLANNREAHPQKAWMNPLDAAERGIKTDDRIAVWNDRGKITLRVMVTPRIMPGVLSVPQGAWLERGPDGTDHGGAVNVLTSMHRTPYAKGNAQHTVLAQVAKATDAPAQAGAPSPRYGAPV